MNEYINLEIENLTSIQKQAVNWSIGPLLVIAGPGSGKTMVLTLRIAKIISESSDDSFRVLGLTFTNKAADEMKSRVAAMMPESKNRVVLNTFHGFCAEVLRNHGSYVNVSPNFSIYSDTKDLQELLKDIAKDLDSVVDLNRYDIKNMLPIIQYLQRELVPPTSSLEGYIQEANIRDVVSQVYRAYFAKLKELNVLDFESLIFKANELFQNFEFIAKHYRMIYKYICVDEFQDTNHAQYQLIKSITQNQFNNVFMVADDDQLIYQWNGASHRRIQEFINDFSAETIQLPDNFRCPPKVVQLANNLIVHNKGRFKNKEPLRARKLVEDNGKTVRVFKFSTVEDEIDWIATNIKERFLLEKGEFAVIARSNKLLQKIYEKLQKNELPCVITKRKNQFESAHFYWLHSILRLANKRNDEKYLTEVTTSFEYITDLSVNTDEVMALSNASDGDYLRGFYRYIENKGIEGNYLRTILIYLIEGKDFIEFIKQSLEWLSSYLSELDDDIHGLFDEEREVWKQFIDNVYLHHGYDPITLSTFLQEMDLTSKQRESKDRCVQCLTIHASKGKEFNHVYLLGLVEDELPSYNSKKKGEASFAMEEERRGCFVAITRTTETLTLSYATRYNGFMKLPSRFLREMGITTS